MLKKAREITGRNSRYPLHDEDFAELERQINEGIIKLPNRSNNTNTDNEIPQYRENITHHYYLTKEEQQAIANGETDIDTVAAEAGCLWLSGKSNSEFTIATHFPKSYRLVVQLIEKIRTQETGRSANEQT